MDLTCLVIPRVGLVPAECKWLGEALHRWLSADPAGRSVERLGLDDLRDGEFPQPQCLRLAWAAGAGSGKGLSRHQKDIRDRLGERADARDVECHIRAASREHVRQAVRRFARAIPGHLVEDILIDGRSWREFGRSRAARTDAGSARSREGP
jgi:hypothetical protein